MRPKHISKQHNETSSRRSIGTSLLLTAALMGAQAHAQTSAPGATTGGQGGAQAGAPSTQPNAPSPQPGATGSQNPPTGNPNTPSGQTVLLGSPGTTSSGILSTQTGSAAQPGTANQFVVPGSDLSLHDAIQRAVTGIPAELADARVAAAKGLVRQAGLSLNPILYLSSEDFRPWASNFDFANQTEDYGYLGQTIEVDGKRGKRLNFARARERQTEAERLLQFRSIAGRVTIAYWNAVALTRIASLLREDRGAVAALVLYNQERVDAGATRGVDLLRTQIELDRIDIALAAAERDAAQARLELFRQMGQPPAANITLTSKLEDVALIVPIVLTVAMDQRPDILAAREAVNAAQADLKLQHALAFPDPFLLGGYKRNSNLNTGFGSLQYPLAIRARNQGEIERARAGITIAQTSLTLLERQVAVEIAQAQQSYEAQGKIVREILPDMRSRARKNLDLTTEAYRLGGIDLLRFIDAERTEFDVEVSALRTLAQYQQSAVQLQLATGVQP